jgi:hypothetical protein
MLRTHADDPEALTQIKEKKERKKGEKRLE